MYKFNLVLSFLLFISFAAVHAQTVSAELQSELSVCKQESFEKVEKSYNQKRLRSESLGRIERELKEIVSKCSGFYWHSQAEEYLRIVQEELAEKNFVISRYYWNKFLDGKTKKPLGVRSRLEKIIENYPNYSKIDEVKILLYEVDKMTELLKY